MRSKTEFCQMLGTRHNSPIKLRCLDGKRGGRLGPCTARAGSGYGILRPSRTRQVGSGGQCPPCPAIAPTGQGAKAQRSEKTWAPPGDRQYPLRSHRGWPLPGWRLRTIARQQTGKFPTLMRRVCALHAAQPSAATFRATVAGRWGIVCAGNSAKDIAATARAKQRRPRP